MNVFFDGLGQTLARVAGQREIEIEAPSLDEEVRGELLDLAKVVAHSQERFYAPLACFLAGIAVERMRAAGPSLEPGVVAAYLREVMEEVERSEM